MAGRAFERLLNQLEAGAEQRDPEVKRKQAQVRRRGRPAGVPPVCCLPRVSSAPGCRLGAGRRLQALPEQERAAPAHASPQLPA